MTRKIGQHLHGQTTPKGTEDEQTNGYCVQVYVSLSKL